MTQLEAYLQQLEQGLAILKEREAKYAGEAPVALLNEIRDYEMAIALTGQRQAGDLSEADWQAGLAPLIIAAPGRGSIPAPWPPVPLQRPRRAEHFTGRAQELAQLLAELQPGRVATLCGPGGIGKTALAAEAIWQLAPGADPPARFPDGIIFHNFYTQPQVELALEQIARTFGEEPKPTPQAAAQRVLAGRRLLLLLDGAEEADRLDQVLTVAGGCGVLVTSRNRQDAVAERQDIAPLPWGEAVALLQAWGQAYAADEAAARDICQLLGRLPLAVRLAGRYLVETNEPAGEYLAWLAETPLRALEHGQRREQSVPLLLERSLAQVSPEARQVVGVAGLLALAPFRREIVAAALDVEPNDLRRPLGDLVNYGLLRRDEAGYGLSHALIHTYAGKRLEVAAAVLGRLVAVYEYLFDHYSQQGPAGYRVLDGEQAHLLYLLGSCAERAQWQGVLDLVGASTNYLTTQGHMVTLQLALGQALPATRQLGQRQNEGAVLGNLGLAYRALGQVEQAIDYHQQALLIHREIGYRQGEASDLGNLGLAYRALGQVEQARHYLRQALTIFEEIKSPTADLVKRWLTELTQGAPDAQP